MIDKLPAEASLYDDSAYTQYRLEELLWNEKCILLKIQRKTNAKRIVPSKKNRKNKNEKKS